MKRFFLILFVAFVLSLPAPAQTIDLQVGGVEIGTTYPTVIQKLGKPVSKKKGGIVPCGSNDETLLTLRYRGLALELTEGLSGKFFVFTAKVTSPKWSVSGIRVGASVEDVKKKFGSGELTKEKGLEYLSYYITDGYANFVFQNNKLVKVDWELNLC
jgi:hypothetical protein